MPNYDQKQMLYIENIDSDIFEKAIFIVKKNPTSKDKKDFVKEAERIIAEYIGGQEAGRKKAYEALSKSPNKKQYKRKMSRLDIILNTSLFLVSILFLYYVSQLFA